MPRISDAEIIAMEKRADIPWAGLHFSSVELQRIIAALREAYQELDIKAKSCPYQYQPRICPACERTIVVGVPHACADTQK